MTSADLPINACDMTRQQLIDTFVFTDTFWAAAQRGHHVLIGSRGSGKTAIARMLGHDYLALSKHPRARAMIAERELMGIYVHTQLEWVGALQDKAWHTPGEAERLFVYRFNLETCLALLATLRSCLRTYYPERLVRLAQEEQLVQALTSVWLADTDSSQPIDLDDFERRLRAIDARQLREDNRAHVRGTPPTPIPDAEVFHFTILKPLEDALRVVAPLVGCTESTVWALCIDEAEFLEDIYLRILNSVMRASESNLFVKLTTTPYHFSVETNLRVQVSENHDFSYLYIDRDPQFERRKPRSQEPGMGFAESMFALRYPDAPPLLSLLGHSSFLSAEGGDWSPDSELQALLEKYASAETQRRARSLSGVKFSNEIGRKIEPLLRLRQAADESVDIRPSLFSGIEMMIRCSDVNPRKLVRLFRAVRSAACGGTSDTRQWDEVPAETQAHLLGEFAQDTLDMVVAEPRVGPLTFALITTLGESLRRRFYESPVSTDPVFSVEIGARTDSVLVEAIHDAVGLGAMYPHSDSRDWGHHPSGLGRFRLSYALAPQFGLLPTVGDSRGVLEFSALRRLAARRSPASGLRQRVLGQSPLPAFDELLNPTRTLQSELERLRRALLQEPGGEGPTNE